MSGRGTQMWEVFGAALALGVGYLMLLAVPAVSQHLHAGTHGGEPLGRLGVVVLALGAMGLALAGSAALVLVLMQLAAEARKHPHAFLSPLLAAFATCILIGLGAKLPLPGIATEYVAVCTLMLAVAGGALLADARPVMQIVGVLLALWPSVTLLITVWVTTGKGDPAEALWSLPPATMSFVVLLLVSSFAIASLALVVNAVEQGGRSPSAPAHAPRPERTATTGVSSITPLALAVTARFDTPSGARPVIPAAYMALPPPPPMPAPPVSLRPKPNLRLVRNATIAVLSLSLLVAIGRALAGPPTPPPAPAEINLRTKPVGAPVVSAMASPSIVEAPAKEIDAEPRVERISSSQP